MKKRHETELAKYVQEHNIKYKSLMNEKMDLEDKLEDKDKLI